MVTYLYPSPPPHTYTLNCSHHVWMCRRSARPTPAKVRGARATAGSRTRTHAMWGKQRAGEVEESQLFAKSLGKSQKDYFPTGNDAVADFLRVIFDYLHVTLLAEFSALRGHIPIMVLC